MVPLHLRPQAQRRRRSTRFWKIKPFYQAQLAGPTETLQELLDLLDNGSTALEHQVQVWEQDPFCPDAIARAAHLRLHAGDRPEIPGLPDQAGDMLFLRETREYLNEAKLLYLLAAEILGERPTMLPAQEPPTLTANVLLGRYQAILDGDCATPSSTRSTFSSSLTTTQSGVAARSSNLRLAPPSPITRPDLRSRHRPADDDLRPGRHPSTFNTLLLFCLPENDVLVRAPGRRWPTGCSRSGTA